MTLSPESHDPQGRLLVINYPDRWAVKMDGTSYGPLTSEQAVTVATLLVAAERIAGGAEVAPPRDHGVVGDPASARRAAIDLLNAADEAEAEALGDQP